MVDNLTKEQRSKTMSRIRSKWTAQEKKLHGFLKARKIKHKMHPLLEGNPDIILKDKKVAVFLHGCFWHMCHKCYVQPKSRKGYWLPKLEKNIKRDKVSAKKLRKLGYKVIIIWEHDVKKDIRKVVNKLEKTI